MGASKQHVPEVATRKDLNGVVQCVHKACSPYIDALGITPAPLSDDYEELIRKGFVSIIRDKGKIVGCWVMFVEQDYLILGNVAVDPVFQGKGIGQRFLEAAKEHARSLGVDKMCLYTNAAMTQNIDIYKHLGFKEIDRRKEQGYYRVYFEMKLGK